MANPNIVNVTSIYGETVGLDVTTANANVVQNGVSSGSIYKINSIYASNLNEVTNMSLNIDLIRLSNTFSILKNVTIPYNATIVALSKDSTLYLREGDALQVSSSSNANVQVVCSYEVIS